ncbi:GntR family transcriptional regulator [Microbacterium sp. A93]|uniref:GntR family transcriptional regulator n=1 Tax=Microbacterium sp. A93 TaxID=3450716 RepID=UPI003F4272E5
MAEKSAAELATLLSARDSRGIAAEVRDLITSGQMIPGSRLPTVRAVATELSVSVGTVAKAWSILRDESLVDTRQRGGTLVSALAGTRPGDADPVAWSDVDFLFCSPDPELLPSLEGAVFSALSMPHFNEWGREYIVPNLHRVVARHWPFEATGWMTAGGGTEGLWLATRAAVGEGSVVACEEPVAPGFLAGLREQGLTVIGIPVDDDGPDPSAVRAAVDAGAAALVLSPGGPFSDRHVLSADRAAELAELLASTSVNIVENDVLGPLSPEPVRSLGGHLPHQTIRVEEYCRAFGIDLRTSVIGGDGALVDAAIHHRSGGVASNSRLLQNALATLLSEPATRRLIDAARQRYALRRQQALEAFASTGMTVHSGPGSWALWADVHDERAAALALGGHGIVTDVSENSYVGDASPRRQRLRLSIAQMPERRQRLDELAGLVAAASTGVLAPIFP